MKNDRGNKVGRAIIIVAVFTGGVTSSYAEETSLRPRPILESALAGVNAAVVLPERLERG
ncbi:MAG: hypothetical protein OXG35_24120 [Acidobacteria bacterium]|nr:hypothetical protein [Acidobacteriota bacterium]